MFEMHNGPWTLGVLIGLPVAVIIILIAFFGGIILAAISREILPLLVGLAAAVIVAVITGIVMWPWQTEYHRYQDVTGTVTGVSHRVVTSGSGDSKKIEDKYVVSVQGTDKDFGILDTRASLLKQGDTVHLRCLRVYEFRSSNNGYDCKWGN